MTSTGSARRLTAAELSMYAGSRKCSCEPCTEQNALLAHIDALELDHATERAELVREVNRLTSERARLERLLADCNEVRFGGA